MKSLCLLFGLLSFNSYAQKFTINGSIKDSKTGEHLIGATIFNPKTQQGTTTNVYGFYSFTQPRDSVLIRISYVGYEPVLLKFLLSRDTTINIGLAYGTTLKELVVEGNADDRIQETTRMGTIEVPLQQIKSLPAFLGEVDVFKVLQLLPGVQSGSEGSSGLYVRGGGPEQNLILLDGVPVYNASHLFGFFSVFNADAVNRVELIKGGFPARYGGRLSSVIDINMKEGDANKFKAEGSVGIVASRLTLEGPIVKGKTSFIISGRRTYIDALASPFIRIASDGEERGGYYFYDLNAKINHRFNEKNRLYLSAYSGKDKAFAKSKYTYSFGDTVGSSSSEEHLRLGWGNITTALRWNSIITKKLFSNVTATYSRYQFLVQADSKETQRTHDSTSVEFVHSEYGSGIRDFALKVDFDYLPSPNHFIRFGGQAIYHRFTPGVLSYRSTDVQDTTLGADVTDAKEFFAYVEDDVLITHRLKMNIGIHASGFSVENRFYKSLQPRVSGRYLISSDVALKASYARMTQYIHLLSNAGIGLPTDLWVPATATVGPENSYLTSLGAAYNYKNQYEASVEGYYKAMDGLIEYKDGADYLDVENDWQNKVEVGKGESYGAEFFVQKKTGKISGWIGYTLSWTNRTFENINRGESFPYRYDRRHDIKIAAVYQWKQNREFSLTWVYGSGSAVTLPKSVYEKGYENPSPGIRGEMYEYYGDRNSFRMRAYHRLDLSYTTTKKTKWGERSWSIGAYNLYNRRNPFFMDITGQSRRDPKFVQYSLFPIIPSIAYRFKF
jgi:outer membrane receptor for ferrienterochelin and colicin